jgi:hypothetical protein
MSRYIEHARAELEALGYFKETEDRLENEMNKMVSENIFELLETFGKQGHSGMSAPFVLGLFHKLASWNILSPLTLELDEFVDCSLKDETEPRYQNKRLSKVFMNGGEITTLDAIIWRENNCSCYTGGAISAIHGKVYSTQKIKHKPYIPKEFYIDVITKEDGESYVIDEAKLQEALDYFANPTVKSTEVSNDN